MYACEVLPRNYGFSLLNLKTNDLMNKVRVRNLGVGGIKRQIAVPLRYRSYSYSVYRPVLESNDSMHADLVTLTDIMEQNNIDHIDFLKLDCEGSEYEIFRSIDFYTLRKVKEIMMEFHGSPIPIVEKFEKSGFRVTALRTSIRAYNKSFSAES